MNKRIGSVSLNYYFSFLATDKISDLVLNLLRLFYFCLLVCFVCLSDKS